MGRTLQYIKGLPTFVKVGAAVLVLLGAVSSSTSTAQTYVKLPARVSALESSDARQTRMSSYLVCVQEESSHGHDTHVCKRLLSPEDLKMVEVD